MARAPMVKRLKWGWERYSAVPTRAAARAPKAWERAVRCGTAVMGIMAMGTPMTVPRTKAAAIQV